jgi:hypothetical protein
VFQTGLSTFVATRAGEKSQPDRLELAAKCFGCLGASTPDPGRGEARFLLEGGRDGS